MECPNCQNHVLITEAQYGALFTCPQCQAVYFVGFDGTPQFEAASDSLNSQPLDLSQGEVDSNGPDAFGINSILNPQPADAFGQSFQVSMPAGQVDPNASGFTAQDFLNNPRGSSDSVRQNTSQQTLGQIDQQPSQQTGHSNRPLQRPIPQRPSIKKKESLGDTLNEISDFGNSDVASPMLFSVRIEGLDTRESIQNLFEALSDKKFNFVSEDLIKKIKNGELQIDDLNPVAAHVLAKRIQFLDLQATWSFKNAI